MLLALVAALALGIAACGYDDDDGGGAVEQRHRTKEQARRSRPESSPTSAASTTARFNVLANKGLEDARRPSSASRAACCISKSNGDYVPNLTTLAQQQYDLVIGRSAS